VPLSAPAMRLRSGQLSLESEMFAYLMKSWRELLCSLDGSVGPIRVTG